jgi:hypothetical protein
MLGTYQLNPYCSTTAETNGQRNAKSVWIVEIRLNISATSSKTAKSLGAKGATSKMKMTKGI